MAAQEKQEEDILGCLDKCELAKEKESKELRSLCSGKALEPPAYNTKASLKQGAPVTTRTPAAEPCDVATGL
ncbi:hypothetical protein cyc_00085 [Cyclospora cayetanensis]|uniref:Uncharacterized protein n=1 Tax=Cyclospora cayetanensis TaxID=88456 RepID=A0A1D3D453_9EIME|nr:hypothetical protein cyc_00085 [Cyclospora cayetanensis]